MKFLTAGLVVVVCLGVGDVPAQTSDVREECAAACANEYPGLLLPGLECAYLGCVAGCECRAAGITDEVAVQLCVQRKLAGTECSIF
ncbi:MAG: hypothetical protein HY905_04110 [Deltaproteobacteria bacterium]|nr:hypothetical protein [Deltaproteobacteria bacterium]